MPGSGRGKDGPKGGGRGMSPGDFDLWRDYARGVEPFEEPGWNAALENEEIEFYRVSSDDMPAVAGAEEKQKKRRNPAGANELDGKTDERFRKGKLPIEARLDLHGMTQDQAQDALTGFLQEAQGRGSRCVLVITGKGDKQKGAPRDWWDGPPGVLRERVPDWLSQKPLSEIVVKHYEAQPKDGGSGARYVYLRRIRG